MSLLIKNGEIVTADSRYVADILCENETITRIDKNIFAPKNCEVIDAKGKFIFPGFIDPHVHIYLPFMEARSRRTLTVPPAKPRLLAARPHSSKCARHPVRTTRSPVLNCG